MSEANSPRGKRVQKRIPAQTERPKSTLGPDAEADDLPGAKVQRNHATADVDAHIRVDPFGQIHRLDGRGCRSPPLEPSAPM